MTDGLLLPPGGGATEATGDWRTWESQTGAKVFRGGPGSFMYVPAGCPHAFFNPGPEPARMLFLVSPSGHETYLQELTDLLAASGPPDQAEIAALRARHDIHQPAQEPPARDIDPTLRVPRREPRTSGTGPGSRAATVSTGFTGPRARSSRLITCKGRDGLRSRAVRICS
jgi:hypothetical protein